MKMRHWAAADHLAAAQARLGHVLAKRSRPAILHVGDLVWMDSRHTPNDIPFKLTARWFGPFTVVQVKGAQATLDLPSTFGKAHRQVNIARLKFFEPRDSTLGDLICALNRFGVTMECLIMKLVAFAMQDAIKALTGYGWNGRVTTNLKMDGWLGLPYYTMYRI